MFIFLKLQPEPGVLRMNIFGEIGKLQYSILEFAVYFHTCFSLLTHCAVPENIYTSPQKGLEFQGGGGFFKKFKETY